MPWSQLSLDFSATVHCWSAFQQNITTVGETTANIYIDGACTVYHPILVVSDQSIPIDVLVGRTWLNLPHINYYKRGNEFIINGISAINPSVTNNNTLLEVSDIHSVLVNADKSTRSWLVEDDVKFDPQASTYERVSLIKLLNEYWDVYAKFLAELWCTNLIKMDIA